MDERTPLQVAADHWSARVGRAGSARTRWWQHPHVVRHVNRVICGRECPGIVGGDIALLRDRFPNGFDRSVSVGCGGALKEMALLAAGVVRHFDLYEISPRRVEDGRGKALERGLTDRMTWHQEPMDFGSPGGWDLVYWSSALHHMFDVDEAVRWSAEVGRHFYMNDFVGPTRWQWPDNQLEIASRVRASLPRRLLGSWPVEMRRPDPEKIADPTEAADSDNILPAIRRHLPKATVKLTGGVIYHLALNDVMANFTDDDAPLLDLLLLLDETLANAGQTHKAVAVS